MDGDNTHGDNLDVLKDVDVPYVYEEPFGVWCWCGQVSDWHVAVMISIPVNSPKRDTGHFQFHGSEDCHPRGLARHAVRPRKIGKTQFLRGCIGDWFNMASFPQLGERRLQ